MGRNLGTHIICFSLITLLTAGCTEGTIEKKSRDISSIGATPTPAPVIVPPALPSDLPAGAILAFTSATCPTGWATFNEAKGRVIVGAGSGNTDASGVHLTARTLAQTGGREYTTGIPARTSLGSTSTPSAGALLARGMSAIYAPNDNTTTLDGLTADSNMPPYIVYTYCKKTVNTQTSLENSVVATKDAACPTGTSSESSVNGRLIVGAGDGNTDADGAALTSRTLAASGGREYTTGIPASTALSTVSIPGPANVIAQVSNGFTPPANLVGTTADGNIPPFVARPYCKISNSFAEASLTSLIVAFDLASCPTGWSEYVTGRGRTIFGAGSGNVDVAGSALTNRAIDSTGGREYTTGVDFSLNSDDENIPGPHLTFASLASASMYTSGIANTTLGGAKADSNMPPFYVATYCTKD